MKLGFDMDYESGDDVLMVEELARSFGPRRVFQGVSLRSYKGDRIALVGPNGSGKTTFLKIIHGILPPSAGNYRWGVGVEQGYFSQDLDALDRSRTCFEEMLEIPGFTKFDAHSLLGAFLFSGEDAHKSIALCSGGERNRLILAKLMVAGANVLLLDEPTNHLDLESKHVLEDALTQYPGTIFFVSHDRYFVDRVATKIWEFENAGVTEYEGNYSDYKAEKRRLAEYAESLKVAAGEPVKQAESSRQQSIQAARERREEKRAQELLRRLEEQIHSLESRKEELEEKMTDPDVFKTALGRQTVAEYNALKDELERLYVEWEAAAG